MNLTPVLIEATLDDYSIVQNMARFYVYDISRYCGFISEDWACPDDGLYECFDFKKYFVEPECKAFLVRVGQELAGFVLLKYDDTSSDGHWDMSQFFILAKFQGHGVASQVAKQVWEMYPGHWEVSVIPENTKGLAFWRRLITDYTAGSYKEEIRKVDHDEHQPNRYFFSFDAIDHSTGKNNA